VNDLTATIADVASASAPGSFRRSAQFEKTTTETRPWREYTDIIIAIGVHDAISPNDTPNADIAQGLKDAFSLIESDEHLKTLDIIWRTAPLVGSNAVMVPTNDKLKYLNEIVREHFLGEEKKNKRFRMVDAESIVITKSEGEDRVGIEGDSSEHFGAEARTAFIQAMINVMLED